jgi:hypothetical protein
MVANGPELNLAAMTHWWSPGAALPGHCRLRGLAGARKDYPGWESGGKGGPGDERS